MNKSVLPFIQWIVLTIILILSGCSSYQQITQENIPSRSIPVHNGQLEYYQLGHGSPIVLIPGYVTDISSWDRKFIFALAQQHQVIVLNNRNVGRSFINSPRYESADLAEDTYQLIHVLQLHKPAILGISMGGMIAQKLAVLHANQLGQLILINTAIAGKQSVHPNPIVEQEMLALPKNKLHQYTRAVELFFPPNWRMQMAYTLATERFQPENYVAIKPAYVITQQRHLIMDWVSDNKTADELHTLHLPTLILNGESDVVIPPINSVILAKTIQNAELIRWKEGGHAMIYQFPIPIARSINHFLLNTG